MKAGALKSFVLISGKPMYTWFSSQILRHKLDELLHVVQEAHKAQKSCPCNFFCFQTKVSIFENQNQVLYCFGKCKADEKFPKALFYWASATKIQQKLLVRYENSLPAQIDFH